MLSLLLLAAQPSAAGVSPNPASATDECRYDMASLDTGFTTFDQDSGNGWRALSMKPGCEEAAANMIRAYRMNAEARMTLLYWHEGQLRAEVGDYRSAISLMEKSHEQTERDRFGWNAYVDATIAFLRNDQRATVEARERLASLPKPNMFNGKRSWPPNLDVVDGLIKCFGQAYKVAYGSTCRAQPLTP